MDSWYWISEYIKVLVGYLFLMFLWPLVVFHGHLRTRSKTYRFGFCVTVPIVIANVTVKPMGSPFDLLRRFYTGVADEYNVLFRQEI